VRCVGNGSKEREAPFVFTLSFTKVNVLSATLGKVKGEGERCSGRLKGEMSGKRGGGRKSKSEREG
jgi:hypothetical protein